MSARGRTAAFALAVAVAGVMHAGAASAQAPPNWRVQVEAGTARQKAPEFSLMPPGWHITTGPAVLLYDPRRLLESRFSLATELFLFPESTQEGYGIFVAGRDLDGGNAHYIALQLRRDGSAAVLQKSGGQSKLLSDWKPVAEVGPHPGKDTQRIAMSIEADTAALVFKANGAEVARLPKAGLDLSGQFGFRVGSGMNLHVVRLDTHEQIAPPARRGN